MVRQVTFPLRTARDGHLGGSTKPDAVFFHLHLPPPLPLHRQLSWFPLVNSEERHVNLPKGLPLPRVAATNMKNKPQSLGTRVAQNAPRPHPGGSSSGNAATKPSYQDFPICPSIFSMKCVDLSRDRVFPDAMRFPDIFSSPPRGSNADLLDFKGTQ